ncbi:MAG: type II toxin-antitoxin system HicB family antitoxin [Armatimonadetes bacterium]|nr:type II toxin-antitoxin system HicB family antitoxin [Armatimonadota bacterium]
MRTRQDPAQRKMGVNVSLDLQTLAVLDQQAAAAGMTRSALLRRMIMDSVAEMAEDQALLAQAEAILEDPNEVSIPWEDAKALLGR